MSQRLLSDQQHAARARRRIINRAQHVLPRERLSIGGEKHVNHQLDRITRRIESTRSLPLFIEGPIHDVLEDVTHHRVLNARRSQRQRREMLNHCKQAIRRTQLLNQLRELERCPNIRDVVRETVHVAEQRLVHVIVHRRNVCQIQRGDVIETQAETIIDRDVDQERWHPAACLDELDDVILRVLQQTLETAQDRERQNVVAVLLRFDDVTQKLVSRPPHDARSGRRRRSRCLVCHAIYSFVPTISERYADATSTDLCHWTCIDTHPTAPPLA